ncbi:MAG: ribonuclease G, partial [Firmicutes bacterium]|nr:ribonuclease G [Bacillota bacterium]
MPKTLLFINLDAANAQVAVTEDGELKEYYVEQRLARQTVGNIYRGRVVNVLPGMQAAFVDIGLERNAFL